MTKSTKRKAHDAAKLTAVTPVSTPLGMYPIVAVSEVDIAFPASVSHLMPAYADIPRDFENAALWRRLFADLFFSGASDLKLQPRESVDASAAFRHIRCILGSYEPKHEHKSAAVAWLFSQWFVSATWSKK